MALEYDFDMVPMTPEGLPDQFGNSAEKGIPAQKVAMFRSPATVAALNEADPAVRAYFIDSGFAMQVHTSGAPAGRYPERDEDARVALIDRLSANMETHDLGGVHWGGFDFDAFMQALARAEPIEDELLAPLPDDPTYARELRAAQAAYRRNKGRRMLALGGLLVGLVLLFYAASQTLM